MINGMKISVLVHMHRKEVKTMDPPGVKASPLGNGDESQLPLSVKGGSR